MANLAVDNKVFIEFDKNFYNERIQSIINLAENKFQKILKSYTLFNFFFILLIIAEFIYFFVHLTLFIQTFVIAIHLALIFATIFCYMTLHMYVQTQKAEKLINLKDDFISACQQIDQYQHMIVSEACCKLAANLHGKEYEIYKCPNWCLFLSSSFEKINCWWFWQDLHFLKELLLHVCVNEHIKLVRMEPTNLEVHAALGNAYVMLSGIYVDPRLVEGMDDDRWIPPNKYNDVFKQKFKINAEKAIEEFKILCDYAPNDPWVHIQLAYSYRDLKMPKEEIREYEILLELCPEDYEIQYKLGQLYFQQGYNAKGLKIYEALKNCQFKKSESLINFYGAY